MLARRRTVESPARERAAREVARHLEASPEFAACRRLVVYAALPDELPLTHVVERARAAGKRLLWPRVLGAERMVFAAADRVESLVPGRYGVREPVASAPIETLGPDVLVLVPGVAFDACGGRLGRGGGFWDRAFAEARGAVIFGVGYELQIIDRVPREAHDRPVAAFLSEVGIRRFGSA
jgi:5-formyltetrahydrofolate cyclo-ligase